MPHASKKVAPNFVTAIYSVACMMMMMMQEARELNIGGLMTATTYIARVQALDVTGSAGLSTSILFTTPLLQTSSSGTVLVYQMKFAQLQSASFLMWSSCTVKASHKRSPFTYVNIGAPFGSLLLPAVASGSTKVVDFGTNRKRVFDSLILCGFLSIIIYLVYMFTIYIKYTV